MQLDKVAQLYRFALAFQSLKRDIPLCNRWEDMNSLPVDYVFQSLKRDIPLCNLRWHLR